MGPSILAVRSIPPSVRNLVVQVYQSVYLSLATVNQALEVGEVDRTKVL